MFLVSTRNKVKEKIQKDNFWETSVKYSKNGIQVTETTFRPIPGKSKCMITAVNAFQNANLRTKFTFKPCRRVTRQIITALIENSHRSD
jgi:hypothetical protein